MGPIIGRHLLTGRCAAAVFCILMGRDSSDEDGFGGYLYRLYSNTHGGPTPINSLGCMAEDDFTADDATEPERDALVAEETWEAEDVEVQGRDNPMSEARRLLDCGRPLREVFRAVPAKQVRERELLKGLVRNQPVLREGATWTERDGQAIVSHGQFIYFTLTCQDGYSYCGKI
jgi:hypothetical protein